MATLEQNINQAINDFNEIRDAIEDKGVEVPDGAPTSSYAEKIGEIEGGSISEDVLIGSLPQLIPNDNNSYYVLSNTNATITNDNGSTDSIVKDITVQGDQAACTGDWFESLSAGGWRLIADIAPLLENGETYCWRAFDATNTYGGIRLGYTLGGPELLSSLVTGSNVPVPASGTFTYDATTANNHAYLAVGGNQNTGIYFQLYKGTTPPEEGGDAITIQLTANEKYPMDNYKGETFYSDSNVALYKKVGTSSYVLPIATANTLGGVKAVQKTEVMTEAVGVDEFGNLYTKPIPNTALPLLNKNVLFIGDSLTFGNMGTDPETGGQLYPDKNYPEYFAELTGCNIYNKGVSGASSTSYYNNSYSNIDFTINYDVVLVMLGTNLGLNDSYGVSYRNMLTQLFSDTNGAARIYLITPPYNGMTSTGHAAYALNSNPVVKAVGQEFCVPVIDTYYESGLNAYNGTLARPIDDLHFNDWGYERLGKFIANQVLAKYWL